jgi:nitrite reductase (NADH) large subunit
VKFVIAGNGIAAITTARTISNQAPGSQIEIYTDERHPFYWRPKLIQFLAGRLNLENLYAYPPEWYATRGVEVQLGSRVVQLDVSRQRILLEDGTEVFYDRLLLAVGSSPFEPPVPGMGEDGVFTLRTIEDASDIRTYAQQCLAAGWTETVVIGGGLLGLECSSALTSLGLQVTALEHGLWLLHRQIDKEGSVVFQKHIERLGIRVMSNAVVERMVASGSVSEVLLEDGRRLPAHLVLCATGVRPNVALASDAGLDVNMGIVVDDQLRTSAENVYAAGDVAEYEGQLLCIIPAAVEQGRVAGSNMVESGSATYRGTVPSTTLKVVGLELTSIGQIDPHEEGDEELRQSDAATGVYQKLVLRDGRIVGAILLGDRQRVPTVTKLIKQGTDVSRYKDRLLDDDVDLEELIHPWRGA